jgi:hypothetical protein
MRGLFANFSVFVSALLLLVSPSSFAWSETDFSLPSHVTFEKRKELEEILSGKSKRSELYIAQICTFLMTDYLWTEKGKVEFNHLFHEMDDEEQQKDVQALSVAMEAAGDCKARVELWLAYDDRWYAPKRAREMDAWEKKRNALVTDLKDTGTEVWDGVINNVVLAVPREYIWLGNNRKDGAADALNISLPFKTKDGHSIRITGVLESGRVEVRPCYGFEGKVCRSTSAQRWFIQYVPCYKGKNGERIYRAQWQRMCTLRDYRSKKVEEPVFDEELKMWRIGPSGYYEGTPEFPSYFLDCGKPDPKSDWGAQYVNPRCRSAVQVNDNLYIYYTFPQREGFWEHRTISETVRKKMTRFIVK